jgi:FdhE protein
MTQVGPPKYDPIPIGEVAIPPFARLPDPLTMFARRAERLKAVADGHQLQSFLLFIADLSDIQHRLQKGLSAAELPALDAIARARQFGMSPLDRLRFMRDAAMDATWERLFAMADDIAMPDAARLALRRVKAADPADEAAMMSAVLLTAIPGERLAEQFS